MKKLGPRECRWLAKDCTAQKWQTQDLNSDPLTLSPVLLNFGCTLSIFLYQLVLVVWSKVRVYSHQDARRAPWDSDIGPIPAFPLGNLLWGHLRFPSLLLADRTVLIGISCLKGCKKKTCSFIHFCFIAVHGPRWPPQASTLIYPLVYSNQPLRKGFF